MKNKTNQINGTNWNYFLMVCCFIFTFFLSTPRLIAQTIEKADSCDNWKSIAAKIDNSKVTLKLSTTNDGKKFLKWTNPDGKMAKLDIYKAKAPINTQGNIEICSEGKSLMNFEASYSIVELKKDGNLFSGYYAIRVILGYSNDRYAGTSGESSNWITIQIK